MRNNGDSKIFLYDQSLDFLPKFSFNYKIFFRYGINLSQVIIMKNINIAFGRHYM